MVRSTLQLKVDSTPVRVAHPVIGRLNIRRLRLSIAMVEGDDDDSLSIGVGHMSGTANAGQAGNMIVAGHRDSAFWPLRDIRKGDRIDVDGQRRFSYRVEGMKVVEENDVSLLSNTKDPMLTLVTCYPFRYVGPAPKRFIVTAKLEQP